MISKNLKSKKVLTPPVPFSPIEKCTGRGSGDSWCSCGLSYCGASPDQKAPDNFPYWEVESGLEPGGLRG